MYTYIYLKLLLLCSYCSNIIIVDYSLTYALTNYLLYTAYMLPILLMLYIGRGRKFDHPSDPGPQTEEGGQKMA